MKAGRIYSSFVNVARFFLAERAARPHANGYINASELALAQHDLSNVVNVRRLLLSLPADLFMI